MTLSLPFPSVLDDDGVPLEVKSQENFQRVALLFLRGTNVIQEGTAAGGALTGTFPSPTLAHPYTYGSTTCAFAAATNTPAVNVSHGLGVVPVSFVALPANGFGVPFWMQADVVANWTTSVVPVAGFSYAAQTATVTFYWLAIG